MTNELSSALTISSRGFRGQMSVQYRFSVFQSGYAIWSIIDGVREFGFQFVRMG